MGSQYHSPERFRKNSQKSIDPWVLLLPSNLLLLKSFLHIWPRTWKQTLEQEEIMPLDDCGHQWCSVWLMQTLGSPLADASSRGLCAALSEATLVLWSHRRSADPTGQWPAVGKLPFKGGSQERKGRKPPSRAAEQFCRLSGTWTRVPPSWKAPPRTSYPAWGSGPVLPGAGRQARNRVRVTAIFDVKEVRIWMVRLILIRWVTSCPIPLSPHLVNGCRNV